MAVIIRNMKMPESCNDCQLSYYETHEDILLCPYLMCAVSQAGIDEDCPMEEVEDE